MNALRSTYRKLDMLQRRVGFRVVATIIVLVGAGVVFGSLLGTTYSLDAQRQALLTAMDGQSLQSEDEHAVTLRETGTVTVGGRTYGGERFARQPELIFDQQGNISAARALTEAFLAEQRPAWAPNWLIEQPGTTWMLAIVFTAWLLLIVWMAVVVPYLFTLLGTAACVGLAWLTGSEQAMWAFAGIGLLTFTFVLLTRAAQFALDRPNQICAVAHTVLKEASRTKISLVIITIILIVLPLIPLSLDPDTPLRFRIQTYISRSLGFTFYLAAGMTLLLSCATVAFEIRDRQIWQLVTKPVSRLSYLLGKWLGVVTVNLIIMLIAAVSIFTFVQYLRDQPVAQGMAGFEDAQQVRDAVLTARVGTKPVYDPLDSEQLRARVESAIQQRADLRILEEISLGTRLQLAQEIAEAYAVGQRTVPPQQFREFRFEGLGAARDSGSTLTLRYRFHIMRDDEHETFPAVFVFNQDPNLQIQRTYVPTISHVLTISPDLIREDGSLIVAIGNAFENLTGRRRAGALNFEEADFELLYRVGSFEANFCRATLIDWVKLSFLAMLGISCSTFLSFPVACLMTFTIFIAGTIGPFLARSLNEYYPPAVENVDWTNIGMVVHWAFKSATRAIGQTLVFLLEAFGQHRPTQALVEGRLIPWVGGGGDVPAVLSLWRVGIVWSGIALTLGYLVIRRRQLAIYSGHG